jgi:arsenate reductase-like glutaredoxin family protein
MQLTTYTLKTCDTCRKALKALAMAGHEITNADVRTQGVPPDVLARLLETHGVEILVNTRSATWRGLSASERSGDALALLQSHPTLMKRPVILAGDKSYVGWTKAVQNALLP